MGALVLRSKNALDNSVTPIDYTIYKQRVLEDGGQIKDEQATQSAINFAFEQGVTSSNVFSAVSPSWGFKITTNGGVKLYSLFGDSGDVIEDNSPVSINNETNGLIFPASSIRSLKTVGSVSPSHSLAVCVVHKIASVESYGTSVAFNLTHMLATDARIQTTPRTGDLTALLGYVRANNTAMPDTWEHRWVASGSDLRKSGVDISKKSVVGYCDVTKTEMYKSNSLLAEGQATAAFGENLQLWIGHGFGGGVAYPKSAPFYGEIYEAWCFVDITETAAMAFSTR